jgi:hypothetical protein
MPVFQEKDMNYFSGIDRYRRKPPDSKINQRMTSYCIIIKLNQIQMRIKT